VTIRNLHLERVAKRNLMPLYAWRLGEVVHRFKLDSKNLSEEDISRVQKNGESFYFTKVSRGEVSDLLCQYDLKLYRGPYGDLKDGKAWHELGPVIPDSVYLEASVSLCPLPVQGLQVLVIGHIALSDPDDRSCVPDTRTISAVQRMIVSKNDKQVGSKTCGAGKNDKQVSPKTRYEVLSRDEHTCQSCGVSAPNAILQVDHIIPRSLGGSNEMKNLQTLCMLCNIGKGAR
jgi:hypothetical protein